MLPHISARSERLQSIPFVPTDTMRRVGCGVAGGAFRCLGELARKDADHE